MHKHKWSYAVKYEPEHFGKHGFKRPQAVAKKMHAINLDDLEKISEKLLHEKVAIREGDSIKIDLQKVGYEKVLGGGKISKPLIIQAKYFSKSAVKKLEQAGGKAVVV
jgi:large subunit ribosomal protein L15